MFKKTLIAEFFTTVSFKQLLNSLYLMTFGFNKLKKGQEGKLLENKFKKLYNINNGGIISFYSGRTAIFQALKIIGVNSTDEVIVNGFNCVSVSNSVLQSGAKIIYSDIEEKTLSFDFKILETNINKNTKVIILQHTFGKKPLHYNEIINLAKSKKILIIEDLAHSLGSNVELLGDFGILSTGRDKVISSVTGGFLLINNTDYINNLSLWENKLKHISYKVIFQNLMYNLTGFKAYLFYDFFKLGRVIIFLSRKFNIITEILTKSEKDCNFKQLSFKLPNALAYLGLKEIGNLEAYTNKRLSNSQFYLDNIDSKKIEILFSDLLNYNGFRFPILLKNNTEVEKLIKLGRNNNIIFGNQWSGQNLIPVGTNYKSAEYTIGDCKISEDISKRILTLPNHKNINNKDLIRVIKLINNF